jgi:short-subunit dehydrogenase
MKRVLITGATSGIGLALAKKYLAMSYNVVACGRNIEVLDRLQASAEVKPGQLDIIQFDLLDKAALTEALSSIEQLDIVILNAGSCEYIDDVTHFDGELFARVIQTNVIAVGYCLAALIPNINRGGHLALMGSSAAYVPFQRAQAYGASKAAIHYLADSLRLDSDPNVLGISLIAPGFVKTPLTDKNDFPMPMQVSAEQAAEVIFSGINKNNREIHFPFLFTCFLKLMGILPRSIWHWLALRMKR